MANLALSAATFDNEEPKNTGILQKLNPTITNTNEQTSVVIILTIVLHQQTTVKHMF